MEDYSTKLTAEPFLYNETKIIGEYLLSGENVQELKRKNIEENLIKHKKQGSVKRTNAPIFRRLEAMNNDILENFVYSDVETSKYLLVYAIMKTDKLVRDFIIEVYKDKIIMRNEYIEKYDIDRWYEMKKESSVSLKNNSDITNSKAKQVIMKILQDSGMVVKETNNRFRIIKPLLNDKFIHLLEENKDIEYAKAIGGLLWKV